MIEKLLKKDLKIFLNITKFCGVIVISSFLIFSCKSVPFGSKPKEVNFSEHLYKKFQNSESKFFTCEQIELTLNGSISKSIKAKVNIHRGDYIFASVNFMGFELGRAEITSDSVKIINRIAKTFYFNSISHFNSMLNLELSYDQIESLILKGIIVEKGESRRKFFSHIEERSDSFVFNSPTANQVNVKSFFDKKSFIESKLEIFSFSNDFFYLQALITKYNKEGTYPESIKVYIKKGLESYDIDLKLGKILNTRFDNRSFVVNNKYIEIEF